MSETIDYSGEFEGFKSEEEIQELYELIDEHFSCEGLDITTTKNKLEFSNSGGWRGGGRSCHELVIQWLGDWLERHPHIKGSVWAKYVEHAPIDRFDVSAGKIIDKGCE